MATLIDSSILMHFGSIFVVFLLFAILFGILEATKPFGDGMKGVHAILALFISLLFLLSRAATAMIKSMVPWFIILIVFVFFVMLLFRMFGVDDKMFKTEVIGNASVYPWLIIFAILVFLGALGAVFGQNLLEAGGGTTVPLGDGNPETVVVVTDGSTPVVLGPSDYGTSSTTTDSFGVNLMNTLRHPKVLGMMFVLLTGAFLMIFLTKPAK